MSKKDSIKECALILFDQHGYKNVTADMIVEKANVSKGLLFFHYKNMEGLIRVIILDWLILQWNALSTIEMSDLSLEKCIDLVFEITKSGLQKNKSKYKLYFSIMLNEPNFVSKLDLNSIEEYKKMFECLRAIFRNGNVANVEDEIIYLNSILIGVEMTYCMNDETIGEQFFQTTKNMVLERYRQ